MKPRDFRGLLGAYAAGTLTPEEREALFHAALENQVLFDALAGEEALRDLLADPAARAQLLEDLEENRGFWWRLGDWMRKPATLALVGSAAAVVLVVGVVRYTRTEIASPKLVAQGPRPAEVQQRPRFRPAQPEVKAKLPAAPPAGDTAAPPVVPKTLAEAREEAVALAPPAAPPAEMAAEKAASQARDAVGGAVSASLQAPAALSYAILTQTAAGGWSEAAPGATFRTGDRVRLRVRPAADGFVVVTAQDGIASSTLTPPGGAAAGSGQDLDVPSTGALELAGESGEKTLRIFFSTSPQPVAQSALRFAGRAESAAGKRREVAAPAAAPIPTRSVEVRLVYRPK